jgi:hypothetical protein
MTLKHGRTRYTRGCRCDICKAAERDYQRNRYRRRHGLPVDRPDPPKLNVVDSQPIASHEGSVVAAVRAELGAAPAAAEPSRPGCGGAGPGGHPRRPATCGCPARSRASTRRDFGHALEADAAPREARGGQVDDDEFTKWNRLIQDHSDQQRQRILGEQLVGPGSCAKQSFTNTPNHKARGP